MKVKRKCFKMGGEKKNKGKGGGRKKEKGREKELEDGYEALVDLSLLTLGNALGDPNDVTNLLLLQLEIGVEDTVAHLSLEGELVELNLVLEEGVLKGLVAAAGSSSAKIGKETAILRDETHTVTNLVDVRSLCKLGSASRIEMAKVGEKLGTIIHGQLSAKRVDCDGDRPPISLKVKNLLHDLFSHTALVVAEVVEIAKVGAVEGVTNNLDVLLAKVLLGDEVADVRTERSIDENALVEIGHGAAGAESRDCLEHAQRMATLKKLGRVTLVKSACDKKNDVIDHVAVGDVVKELRKRILCHRPKVFEIIHHLRGAIHTHTHKKKSSHKHETNGGRKIQTSIP